MTVEADELEALRHPDPASLGALHDRYFPELYRYANYRVGDPSAAEDIASETFTRLLESLSVGQGPRTSLRGWLFGTARHLVDDHHRRHYARAKASADRSWQRPEPDPQGQVEDKEQRRQVRAALQSLTSEQQHVLALRFGEEYSLEETAALMGKNPNAVKALQHRALQALRRGLEAERR
jgi:RNA polymerase sigma-70 factor (ECF subfamily)